MDVRIEEVKTLQVNCIYVSTCLGSGRCSNTKTNVIFSGMNSAQDASSQVPAVAEAVLDELDVFQVIFDDADEVAQTLLLLLQVLKAKDVQSRAARRSVGQITIIS